MDDFSLFSVFNCLFGGKGYNSGEISNSKKEIEKMWSPPEAGIVSRQKGNGKRENYGAVKNFSCGSGSAGQQAAGDSLIFLHSFCVRRNSIVLL
jgi:hypothetical protein